jgi:NTP pyrophosphatase (non-canonical NTP hydrolase)
VTLGELSERAMAVRRRYAALELQRYGRPWSVEEVALGFAGDVGDLAKLVLAEAGVRGIPDHREKLGHELADCLWSILVLARLCDIDLARAFAATMDQLEARITALESDE